jgi:hypothetical protein
MSLCNASAFAAKLVLTADTPDVTTSLTVPLTMNRLDVLPRDPLYRLLLVNLAAGLVAATLLFGGLLLINPGHLRDLILSDRSPEIALLLLLFGFAITFGSAAMGTAIMMIGRRRKPPSSGTGVGLEPITIPVEPASRR